MVDRARGAWKNVYILGLILMDIQAAFRSVAKGRLVNFMKVRPRNRDHMRWTESSQSDRMVEMIIEVNVIKIHRVEAGVPQGSPVSLILFAIYSSGLINCVEEYVSQAERQSFADDLVWVAPVGNVKHVMSRLARCSGKSIDCVNRRGVQFYTAMTVAARFSRRQGHRTHLRPTVTEKTWGRSESIGFNK